LRTSKEADVAKVSPLLTKKNGDAHDGKQLLSPEKTSLPLGEETTKEQDAVEAPGDVGEEAEAPRDVGEEAEAFGDAAIITEHKGNKRKTKEFCRKRQTKGRSHKEFCRKRQTEGRSRVSSQINLVEAYFEGKKVELDDEYMSSVTSV
jgi:hypothetical protein